MIRHKVLTYLEVDKADKNKCSGGCPFLYDDGKDIFYYCDLFDKRVVDYERCDKCKEIDLQSIDIYDDTKEVEILIKPILKNILISYYIASNKAMIIKHRGMSAYTFSVYANVKKLAMLLGINMEEIKKEAEEVLNK